LGFDDAVFTTLKLVEFLSNHQQSFSQLIAETPSYVSTPTLQAECGDERKYGIVTELVQAFQREGHTVITFDDLRLGGRVEFPDGWGLIRASSNLPVLVLRFEATTPERLEQIQQMFRQKLEEYPEVSKAWESG
jgi:phosphomannomutase/phosphoglucomutase